MSSQLSIKTTVTLCIAGCVLISQLISGTVQFFNLSASRLNELRKVNEAVMQPVVERAGRGVEGGKQMILESDEAKALYGAIKVLYLKIEGAEALIRWRHPLRGLIPPGLFIPFAEQTGFIREITPWLVDQVIADTARWRREGIELVVSANLSTHDLLNAELISGVIDALAREQLPPSSLCLEITESALMDEPERTLQHLDQLAAHGIRLAIDDYGSGQASLAYVRNLPVHELKIDRVFVTDVDSTPKNAAIVRSTVLLCHELDLVVVAEGAERPEEIDWLRQNECDLVQGYGIARPMPTKDFVAWVSAFYGAAYGATPPISA